MNSDPNPVSNATSKNRLVNFVSVEDKFDVDCFLSAGRIVLADSPNSDLFSDNGPLSIYLESCRPEPPDFWVRLDSAATAVKSALSAAGQAALQCWIERNRRVQSLVDFVHLILPDAPKRTSQQLF